ncbi:MAG: primosome assembly protein PriA, partial [Actinobacteria bacterium]
MPVARVCVDVPLAHLDRLFDYLVPADLDEGAQPGTRVRVRFSGQLVDGWAVGGVDASDHGGSLRYIERLVSPEPVLTPEVARLARAIADRYAGTLADVLRLAVPPRHARVEQEAAEPPSASSGTSGPPVEVLAEGWRHYPAGPAFLRGLAAGRPLRAGWSALPGEDWPGRLAGAAAATVASGRG